MGIDVAGQRRVVLLFRYRVLLEVIGILIDIIGLDDILEIYRVFLGKTPERVRRKATGPVRW